MKYTPLEQSYSFGMKAPTVKNSKEKSPSKRNKIYIFEKSQKCTNP